MPVFTKVLGYHFTLFSEAISTRFHNWTFILLGVRKREGVYAQLIFSICNFTELIYILFLILLIFHSVSKIRSKIRKKENTKK